MGDSFVRGAAPLNGDNKGMVMKRTITLNADDMGCEHGTENRVTCGTCMRNWCDICNPTPSARCLYEYEHDEVFDENAETVTFDSLVEDFWLFAEPAYQRFDELTKARINRALEVFKGHIK